MCIWTRLLILLAALTSVSHSQAAGLANMTFDEQVAESDVVALAKPEKGLRDGFHRLDKTGRVGITKLKVSLVLKGPNNIKELYLVTKDEIAERSPNCCKNGKIYLLLLKRGRDNMFEAVNGRHSVIEVN